MLSKGICLFAVLLITNSSFPFNTSSSQIGQDLRITEGTAIGDVTDHNAIIWSRINKDAQMNIEYATFSNFSDSKSMTAIANQTTDHTGKVKLEGLEANTVYYYRVWFSTLDSSNANSEFDISNVITGSFRTAADRATSRQIDFVMSGDLGGQGLCRRVDSGYSIFSLMKNLSPDFFVFNGDQIYADSYCPAVAPGGVVAWRNIEGDFPSVGWKSVNWNNISQLREVYLKHWEYNRNDAHLKELLRYTPLYSQFDDHEVIDNYGGNWSSLPGENNNRVGYDNLVTTGINTFSNFSPIDLNDYADQYRFYRSFNWGKAADLFLLDTRSYRSSNNIVDSVENNKTFLGEDQLEWLKQGLLGSNATWKVISSPNSITVPTCFTNGCDSWATNGTDRRSFISERSNLLKFLDNNNIKNVIFVVTDLHFPANIRGDQDFDGDGDNLVFHELISGPLSAFPLDARQLDPTINVTFLYKESKIFNFAHVSINDDGNNHFVSRIIDNNGIVRPNSILKLAPR